MGTKLNLTSMILVCSCWPSRSNSPATSDQFAYLEVVSHQNIFIFKKIANQKTSFSESFDLDGKWSVSMGWGMTSYKGQKSPELQKVLLPIIWYGRCTSHETGYTKNHIQPESMICAGYLGTGRKDVCEGEHSEIPFCNDRIWHFSYLHSD
jgi:hypothetical protein